MSERDRPLKRERLLAAVLLFVFTLFLLRLVQVQVFEHGRWTNIGRRQSELMVYQKPSRGEIRDRNGIPLAVTLPLTYAVGWRAKPDLDREMLSTELAKHLPVSKITLRAKLQSESFVYLARRVDWQIKQELEALKLPGLQFDEEPRRAYPGATEAAAVIGFCDIDGKGQEGIEAALNDALSGEAHRELCRVDAHRTTASPVAYDTPCDYYGATVSLTLDVQLQSIVENALADEMKGRKYERACALLIDPVTGDILGLSTLPNFDPNRPGDANAEERKCWPITDVYEPGSTLKIVPIEKALESGKLSRTSQIFCGNGTYRVKGATLHDSHPHGYLSLNDILALSSNIGAAKVCERFTPNEIYDKLRAFGFGNLTTIEILGEQAGYLPPPSLWSGPTQSNLAFGHGISCTPLQLAMAYGSIANGGKLMKPRIVKCVEYPSGDKTEYPVEVVRTVMPANVATELTDMLCGVVEHGTGEAAAIEGVRIAGKTGTAQKVDQVHKKYFDKRFVSSFVGFFPAEQPKYLLLVVVDDPRGEYYGAAVAAPVFRRVAEEIIAIRTQDFERTPPQKSVEFATREKKSHLIAPELTAIPVSYSTVFTTEQDHQVISSDTTFVTVPALEGWPLRSAVQELSRRNLNFKLSGNRVVVTQSPAPGTRVPAGTICELYGDSK